MADSYIVRKGGGVDVTRVTATAADVRSPKTFVNSAGALITGTMLEIDYTQQEDFTPTTVQNELEIPYVNSAIQGEFARICLLYKDLSEENISYIVPTNAVLLHEVYTAQSNRYDRTLCGKSSGGAQVVQISGGSRSLQDYPIYDGESIHLYFQTRDNPVLKAGRYKVMIELE